MEKAVIAEIEDSVKFAEESPEPQLDRFLEEVRMI